MSSRITLMALLLLSLVAACDDGGVTVEDADVTTDTTTDVQPTPDATPDVSPDLTPDVAPQPNQLLFSEDGCTITCSTTANAGTSHAIAVTYRRADGTPIVGASIRYSVDVTADIARLASFSATTDANGQASVDLNLLANTTQAVLVTVEASGDADAGKIVYTVNIDQLIPSPLAVTLSHEGATAIASFGLRLYRQEAGVPSCEDLDPDQPGGLPTADLGWGPGPITEVFEVASLPDLSTDLTQTWAIRVVGPPTGVAVVTGCAQGVTVEWGKTKAVTIPLVELPLLWEGNYGLTTTADMHTGIPGTAGEIVDFVIGIFTDPGEVALLAACKNPSGLLDTICGFLTSGDGLSSTGSIAAEAATVAFFDLAAGILGNETVVTGQSIASLLSDLRLGSTLTLTGEPLVPDDSGDGSLWFEPDNVGEVWETASFYWKFGLDCDPNDAQCGLLTVKLPELYKKTLSASFDAKVTADGKLWLEPHTVAGFDYGTLLNFIIEKKILPLMFGDGSIPWSENPDVLQPAIDGYDKLIATIFGDEVCLAFEKSSGDPSPYGDCCEWFSKKPSVKENVPLSESLLEDACELLVPAAAAWITDKVEELSGPLVIGSPAGEGCVGTDFFSQRQADALGSKDAQCGWDATFDLGGTPFKPAATWWGARKK